MLLLGIFLGCGKETIPPEFKDKIVYVCGEGICTINPDGTERKVIVPIEKGGPFSNVRWSPDKRRIAFTGHVEGNTRIMIANPDGSHRKVLALTEGSPKNRKQQKLYATFARYDLEFAGWAPSGRYVLYKLGPVLDASSSGAISIKGSVVPDFWELSPKLWGKRFLVYVARYGSVITTGNDIFKYDFETKEKFNLTNTNDDSLVQFYPVVSQNDKMIAFQSSGPSEDALWIMKSDGSGKKKLAIKGRHYQTMTWGVLSFSPAGDKIMFLSCEGDRSQIYVINTDGTEFKAITDKIVKGFGGVDWSPDGKRIVFTSNKDGNDELYIINVDGSGLVRLTNNETPDCCPDW